MVPLCQNVKESLGQHYYLKAFLPVAKNLLDQISHDDSKHAFKAD